MVIMDRLQENKTVWLGTGTKSHPVLLDILFGRKGNVLRAGAFQPFTVRMSLKSLEKMKIFSDRMATLITGL